MPTDIVLAAINARYAHASLGIRSLRANLGALRERSGLMEFDLQADPARIAETIVAAEPRILGLGIYIWNVRLAKTVLREARRRLPRMKIVLGGPEPAPAEFADLVLGGEGEVSFAEACGAWLAGREPDAGTGKPPDPERLELPDAEYSDADLATRVTYAETSRGCPFGCEYCLSSLDRKVRYFPEEKARESLDRMLRRGARRFKFVDRTFNLDPDRAGRWLDFWLERARPGLSVQYEAVPERFPAALRDRLRRFPPDLLRLEIGVQTLDPAVSETVGRRLDPQLVEDTFCFLRDETKVAVHADLIAGLPGEDLAGFARGFNRLMAWEPVELQVGLLKRLSGAPIARHDAAHDMRYSPEPPYELISHRRWNAEDVLRIKRFARFWDRTYNRGQLRKALPLLWGESGHAFEEFLAFSDWAFAQFGRDSGISLEQLASALARYLVEVRRLPNAQARLREAMGANLPTAVSVGWRKIANEEITQRQE